MNIIVHHAMPGRLRIHYNKREVSSRQAILAQSLIAVQEGIKDIEVNTIVGSYLIYFDQKEITQKQIENLFKALTGKYLNDKKLLENVSQIPETQSIYAIFISTFVDYYARKWILPLPIRTFLLYIDIFPRILDALKVMFSTGKIFSTQTLDSTALIVSCNKRS